MAESWFVAGVRMSESEFRDILYPDCLGGCDAHSWDAYEAMHGYGPRVWEEPTANLRKPQFTGKERLYGDILKLWAYAYFHFGNGHREYKKPLETLVFSRAKDGEKEVDHFFKYLREKERLPESGSVQNWFFSRCWLFDGRGNPDPDELCRQLGLDSAWAQNGGQIQATKAYVRNQVEKTRGVASKMLRIALKYSKSKRPDSFDRYIEKFHSTYEPFMALWNNPTAKVEFQSCLSRDGLEECQQIKDVIDACRGSDAIEMCWHMDRSQVTFNIQLIMSVASADEKFRSVEARLGGTSLWRSRIDVDGECSFPLTAFLCPRGRDPVEDFADVQFFFTFDGARPGEEKRISASDVCDDVRCGYERLRRAFTDPRAESVCCSHRMTSQSSLVLPTWSEESQGVGQGIWIVGSSREIVRAPRIRMLPQFGEVGAVYVPLDAIHEDKAYTEFGAKITYHKMRGVWSYEGLDEDLQVRNERKSSVPAFSGDLFRAVHDSGKRIERRPSDRENAQYWNAGDDPRCVYVPASLVGAVKKGLINGDEQRGPNWRFSPRRDEEWTLRGHGYLEGDFEIFRADGQSKKFSLKCRIDYPDAYCCLRHGDAYRELNRVHEVHSLQELAGRRLCVALPREEAQARRGRRYVLEKPRGEKIDVLATMADSYNPDTGFVEFELEALAVCDGVYQTGEIRFGEGRNLRTLIRLRPSGFSVWTTDDVRGEIEVDVPDEDGIQEGDEEGLFLLSEAILNTGDELRVHPSYCAFVPFGQDLPRGERTLLRICDLSLPREYDVYACRVPYRRSYLEMAYDSFDEAFREMGGDNMWVRVRRGSGVLGVSITPDKGVMERRLQTLGLDLDKEGRTFEATRTYLRYLRGTAADSVALPAAGPQGQESPCGVLESHLQKLLDEGVNFLSAFHQPSSEDAPYDGWWNPNTFLGTLFNEMAERFLPENELRRFMHLGSVSGRTNRWILNGERRNLLDAFLSEVKGENGWCDGGAGLFPAAVATELLLNRRNGNRRNGDLPPLNDDRWWSALGIKDVSDLVRQVARRGIGSWRRFWRSETPHIRKQVFVVFVYSEGFRDGYIDALADQIKWLAGHLKKVAEGLRGIVEYGCIPSVIAEFSQELEKYCDNEQQKRSVVALFLLSLGSQLRAHLGVRIPAARLAQMFPAEFDLIMLAILRRVFELKRAGKDDGLKLLMKDLIATDIMFYELRKDN